MIGCGAMLGAGDRAATPLGGIDALAENWTIGSEGDTVAPTRVRTPE